ncbi:MAG TPA: NAD(P)H dehydrogenase [Pelotomaculum sp.]|nr:NAD(P)H dehydrogenase [Pelotomaculum sp.]
MVWAIMNFWHGGRRTALTFWKKGREKLIKNILLINGSPRAVDSNTILLSNSFLEGFHQVHSDAHIETILLKKCHIQPCRGCFSCWKNEPGKCVLEDDMSILLEKYLAADLVVWSFPLYHFGMPSMVKAFHERTLPLNLPFIERGADGSCTHPARNKRLCEKSHVIISSCGFSSTKNNYEALTKHLDRLHGNHYEKIYCAEGELLRIAQLSRVSGPYLEAVKQAGIEYARFGGISQETHAILETPMLEEEAYLEMANASWAMEGEKAADPYSNLKAYSFMRQMRASFNPEAGIGINAVLQISYSDLHESYQLLIKDNTCRLIVGTEYTPTTTIVTDYDTWVKISEGRLDGPQAMMQKKYRVSGDFGIMMVLDDLFGGRRAAVKQQTAAAEKTAQKKSKMVLFLLPWIVLWIVLPFHMLYAAMAALTGSCLIAAGGETKWDLTIYERINPLILAGVLSLVIFDLADLQILMAVSYFLFALIWLASIFVKIPLTAWYSRYIMGDKALSNSLFIKTNRILTILWGGVFVLTSIWTYYLWYTPWFSYSGLINQLGPILMGMFTAWFSKWYPARVARG